MIALTRATSRTLVPTLAVAATAALSGAAVAATPTAALAATPTAAATPTQCLTGADTSNGVQHDFWPGSTVAPHRTYRMYDPHLGQAHDKPRTLIVSLHGKGGTGQDQEALTCYDTVAVRNDAVVVYPDSATDPDVKKRWAAGLGPRNSVADEKGVDDVGYITALIGYLLDDSEHTGHRSASDKGDLTVSLNLDPKRVYVSGFSQGAMLTERLACEAAGQIAAVAALSGTMPASRADGGTGFYPAQNDCSPARPIPYLASHGTADPWVPYGKQLAKPSSGPKDNTQTHDSVLTYTAEGDVDTWAERDGCTGTRSIPAVSSKDGTTLYHWSYTGCPHGVDVSFYKVKGGGHTWPDGDQYLPGLLVGKTTTTFSAADETWAFFAAHPMP